MKEERYGILIIGDDPKASQRISVVQEPFKDGDCRFFYKEDDLRDELLNLIYKEKIPIERIVVVKEMDKRFKEVLVIPRRR